MSKRRFASDRSQRARELVAAGLIGGKREGAGRPRKVTTDSHPRSASRAVADAAREHSAEIAAVFTDVLADENSTDSEKLRALKVMLNVEDREETRDREDEARGRAPQTPFHDLSREELIAGLTAMFLRTPQLQSALPGLLPSSDA